MRKLIFIIAIFAISFAAFAQKIDYTNRYRSGTVKHVKQQKTKAKISYLDEDFDTEIPATWTITNNGTTANAWEWVDPATASETIDGTGYAFADSDAGGSGATMDVTLTSPGFNASAAVTALLSFDLVYNNYNSYPDTFEVEVFDGTTWVSKYIKTGTFSTPAHFEIDIASEVNANMQVRFRYKSAWGMHTALDNVRVFEPDANDVATLSIDCGNKLPGAFDPTATVKNVGSATQTFDVTMNITPGGYTSTKTQNSIPSDSVLQVTFDNWTPSVGTYEVEVYTTLASNADHTNDTLRKTIEIIDLAYTDGTIYAYNAYAYTPGLADHIVSVDKTTGAQTDIALSTSNDFFTCGDYVGDSAIYAVEYGSNDLYLVNGNGMTVKKGTISGVTSVTGLAYDGLNDVIYLSDNDGTSSLLYTLDMNTMAATLVGTMTNDIIIGIAAGNAGELWAIGLSDTLFSVNTSTGAATPIGPLGIDIGFAQDIGYDRENGILYGTLFVAVTSTVLQGGLYTINDTTGAATLVGVFDDELTMCAIVATDPNDFQKLEHANAFDLYPNPADNMITINVDNDAVVIISDMTGRVVHSSQINNTANISVSELNSGIYFVTVVQDNERETIKLIVE